jgi:hypothetical protein
MAGDTATSRLMMSALGNDNETSKTHTSSAATAEAATKTASPGATMTLPPHSPPADGAVLYDFDDDVDAGVDGHDVGDYVDVDNDANTDPVTDTQSTNHPKATGVTHSGHWTPKEDIELTSAVAKTKYYGKECRKNWVAISALVPGRTKRQCRDRWQSSLNPSIELTAGRTGPWTEDEDSKLRHALQMHGGNDWALIAKLVRGRTKTQCKGRWHNYLNPSIELTAGHTGPWTEDEDNKLSHAVREHGGKNWIAIAALVPYRTKAQCRSRWHTSLNPSIKMKAGREETWTEDEDSKLKDAIRMHSDWATIAALVPRRTQKQCWCRWHNSLKQSIDQLR